MYSEQRDVTFGGFDSYLVTGRDRAARRTFPANRASPVLRHPGGPLKEADQALPRRGAPVQTIERLPTACSNAPGSTTDQGLPSA